MKHDFIITIDDTDAHYEFCKHHFSSVFGATERAKGKWITNSPTASKFFNPGRHCSLCGRIVEFSENFCPNCGADMRGDDNE